MTALKERQLKSSSSSPDLAVWYRELVRSSRATLAPLGRQMMTIRARTLVQKDCERI